MNHSVSPEWFSSSKHPLREFQARNHCDGRQIVRPVVSLILEPRRAPARDLLRDVWAAFPNPDNHFIREFQTAGFDARVWELVLISAGHFGPYTVTRPG